MKRPKFADTLSATEFARTFRLKSVLIEGCRDVGASPTGSEPEITARIVAARSGADAPQATQRRIRGDMPGIAAYARLIVASLVLGTMCGCSAIGAVRATLEHVLALQAELQKELPGEAVTVTASTDGQLTVSLVNSRLGDLPDSARAIRTRAIAVFARDHYGEASAIRVISIVFKSEVGVAGVRASLSQPTNYAISELDEAPSGASTATAASAQTDTLPPPALQPKPVDAVAGPGTAAPAAPRVKSRWVQ